MQCAHIKYRLNIEHSDAVVLIFHQRQNDSEVNHIVKRTDMIQASEKSVDRKTR